MINGIDYLKEKYPGRDIKDYQPSGLDLRLGNLFYMETERDIKYGLIDGEKILPKHKPVKPTLIQVREDDYVAGWDLIPQQPYIAQVKGQIQIAGISGTAPSGRCLCPGRGFSSREGTRLRISGLSSPTPAHYSPFTPPTQAATPHTLPFYPFFNPFF